MFLSKSACCVWAQNWLVSSGFSLDGKCVAASFHEEFALVSPGGTVGVPDNPVLESGLLVSAPSDDDDWVVEILPWNSVVFESFVSHWSLLSFSSLWFIIVCFLINTEFFIDVSYFSGFDLGQVQNVVMKLFYSLCSQYSFCVSMENVRSLQLSVNNTISSNFFHYLLFTCVTVSFADERGLGDFGVRLALFVVSARIALCFSEIRSALICDHVAVLAEEPMEERPSTVASFVHIVASHQVLWR